MPIHQTSRYCRRCGKYCLHQKSTFSGIAGLVLTFLTLGSFLIIWVPLMLIQGLAPYRCQMCGKAKTW